MNNCPNCGPYECYITEGILEKTKKELERLLSPPVRKEVYKIVSKALDEAWRAGHTTGGQGIE